MRLLPDPHFRKLSRCQLEKQVLYWHFNVENMVPSKLIDTHNEKGFKVIQISAKYVHQFEGFLKMLPSPCRKKSPLIDFWHAKYKKLDYINYCYQCYVLEFLKLAA